MSQLLTEPRHSAVENELDGHVGLVPSHSSAVSQTPADGRHSVAIASTSSAGQSTDAPVQLSTTSQLPAEGRQTVVDGWKPVAGQSALVPVHCASASQTPAEPRQTTVDAW